MEKINVFFLFLLFFSVVQNETESPEGSELIKTHRNAKVVDFFLKRVLQVRQ